MNSETLRLIDSIARDRNVDRDVLITRLEQAMVSAARKHFNSLDAEEFGCAMDRTSGEISIWRNNEDGEREIIPLESLGRIPAQTAKQVMIQNFREEERSSLFDEFSKRVGEITTGTAHRYEGGSLIVQIDNRTEGFMPRSEQIPGEQFHPGDRVRCMIVDCRDSGSQVKIVLSRSHPDFIRRLFEAEVPEVAEHIIEIKAMAREAGFRTKLAVSSIDSKVDPVGACVGVRGSRIRNIVDELGGEKIDIVRWNESSQVLIANALKPAEVEDVSLCFELGRATIIVRDDQLSLAIGRRGQNVRLAARLTGWDIDILTPAEFAKSLETLEETLRSVEGITEEMLDRMGALGIISVFDVEEVGVAVLVDEMGMDQPVAEVAYEKAIARAKVVAEEQQREKEEEERRKKEEHAAADALLGGTGTATDETDVDAEAAAANILGGGSARPRAAVEAPADGDDAASEAPASGDDDDSDAAAEEDAAASEENETDILSEDENEDSIKREEEPAATPNAS